MMLKATIAVAVLAGALGASPATAKTITSKDYGFSVKFPDDWTVEAREEAMLRVKGNAPAPNASVNCNVSAAKDAGSAQRSSKEVYDEMREPFGEKWWRDQVFSNSVDLKIESMGVKKHASGAPLQHVRANYLIKGAESIGRVRLEQILIAKPGMSYGIACGARTKDFDVFKTTLAEIMASFRFEEADMFTVSAGTGVSTGASAPTEPAAKEPATISGARMETSAIAAGLAAAGQAGVLGLDTKLRKGE